MSTGKPAKDWSRSRPRPAIPNPAAAIRPIKPMFTPRHVPTMNIRAKINTLTTSMLKIDPVSSALNPTP